MAPLSVISQTFGSVTKFFHICAQAKSLRSLKKIHAHLVTTGLLLIYPILVSGELICAYDTCLHRSDFQTLIGFLKCMNPTNSLPFNVMISHFSRNGLPSFALKSFSFMHANGVLLDSYALCSCLSASSSVCDVKFGEQVHAYVAKSGFLSSVFVGSALIDLYAKSLLVDDAAAVFDEMPIKNTVCANALLAGYVEAKSWIEGVELVKTMPSLHLDYDHFTISAVLRACAGLSAIEMGRQVHGYLIRKIYDVGNDVFLLSSLIEMYGKCGLVGKAFQVFDLGGIGHKQKTRDVVLWTSMLGAYGRNGFFKEAIELYYKMLNEGIRPDKVAFVTVISACSRTGLMKTGVDVFESMVRDFKLNPSPEHYSCLVDLLCRTGELDRAWHLINETIHKGDKYSTHMWGAFLSACEDHGNIEMGKLAAQTAIEMDPDNVDIYVQLSNLYAKFAMWDDIEKLRALIRERGLQKDVGTSWIELTG